MSLPISSNQKNIRKINVAMRSSRRDFLHLNQVRITASHQLLNHLQQLERPDFCPNRHPAMRRSSPGISRTLDPFFLFKSSNKFENSLGIQSYSLRIQICPKKGINPTILLWGWDWDHQTYSREGYGSLGILK